MGARATHRGRQLGTISFTALGLGWVGRAIAWVTGAGETAEMVLVLACLLVGLVLGVLSARALEPYTEREVRDTRSGLLYGGLIVATVVAAYTVSRLAL